MDYVGPPDDPHHHGKFSSHLTLFRFLGSIGLRVGFLGGGKGGECFGFQIYENGSRLTQWE